ncbi:hypothetical protein [Emticicia sp. BO119]|uniref:hypothetical protein n=1 Tax=Emticicia sp. BO119 TaxID=2757768 RepID=UPI0015F11B8D|nr:hypothetical protein [Emticicia sp. BO119]MBA4849904.1 hypothetical protein [Emticicia sp. BO119]
MKRDFIIFFMLSTSIFAFSQNNKNAKTEIFFSHFPIIKLPKTSDELYSIYQKDFSTGDPGKRIIDLKFAKAYIFNATSERKLKDLGNIFWYEYLGKVIKAKYTVLFVMEKYNLESRIFMFIFSNQTKTKLSQTLIAFNEPVNLSRVDSKLTANMSVDIEYVISLELEEKPLKSKNYFYISHNKLKYNIDENGIIEKVSEQGKKRVLATHDNQTGEIKYPVTFQKSFNE